MLKHKRKYNQKSKVHINRRKHCRNEKQIKCNDEKVKFLPLSRPLSDIKNKSCKVTRTVSKQEMSKITVKDRLYHTIDCSFLYNTFGRANQRPSYMTRNCSKISIQWVLLVSRLTQD